MIYTFFDQCKMMLYFLIIGIFLGIMWDIIHILFSKNIISDYLIQFSCWLVVILVILKSIDSVSWGYISIYTFMFFIIGYYVYIKLLSGYNRKVLQIIKEKSKGFLLALFPVSLYNYIIRIIVKKRKNKNEKDNINSNNVSDDDIGTRVWK